jgi:Chitin synthase export chaperone
VYTGLVASAYCCILINGFVGFQFAEDGTPLSLWVCATYQSNHFSQSHFFTQLLRISCLAIFALGFFIAIATFKKIAGFDYAKPVALWIVYILWPVICAAIYVVSQLVLVFRTLDDRWPIGDILFGTAFFVIAQVLLFAFSVTICNAIKHYIDGLFFFTLCMLLSVMMIYKYWDSITVCSTLPFFHTLVVLILCFSERTSNSLSAQKLRSGKSKIPSSPGPMAQAASTMAKKMGQATITAAHLRVSLGVSAGSNYIRRRGMGDVVTRLRTSGID